MALFDIVIPTDHVTISDAIARQLNAGGVAKVFDIQISDEVSVVDTIPEERIVSDTISVTDSIQAQLINTLSIANARALSATKIRIDFSAPAKAPASNPALSNPASYVFTPVSPGAVGVVPQSIDLPPGQTEPLYVEVNITEHTNGSIYEVGLSSAIEGANDEVGGGAPFAYAGLGASPIVLLVLAVSETEAVVQFDEAILDNPSARDVANYVWDNGLSTVSVKSVVGNLVTLETTPQAPGALYNLTVRGVFQIVINDTIQVTDSQPLTNLHTGWFFDEVAVSDQLVAETDYVREASDAIDVTDQLDVDFTQDRVVNDAIVVTDQLTAEAWYDRSISDAIAVTDTSDQVVNLFEVVINDTIEVTDQIAAGKALEVEVSDTVSVTDQLAAEFTAGGGSLTLPNVLAASRTTPGDPETQVSDDGVNWTSTNPAPTQEDPRNIARNHSAGTILICCDDGVLLRSTDEGQTWTDVNAGNTYFPATFDMSAVWYGNGRWIVAGGGVLYYSDDDGLTWSSVIDPDGGTGTGPTGNAPAGFSDVFYDGVYAPGLGLHVGVGYQGAIWTSPDGISWTERVADNSYIGSFYGFRGIEWSESQGLLVAVGDADEVQTSPDGINWTKRTFDTSPAFTTVWSVTYSPVLDLWLAVGNAASSVSCLQTSPDGITWTSRAIAVFTNARIYSCGWDAVNDLFIIGTRFGRVHNSNDGINWTYTAPDTSSGSFVGNSSASIWCMIGGGDGGGNGK